MYPHVDNYTMLCHTWTKDLQQFSRLRINPSKDTGEHCLIIIKYPNYFKRFYIILCIESVKLYVHKKGQFLTDLKNELVQIQFIDYIENIELNIRVSKLISTPSTQCEDGVTEYDSCAEALTNLQFQDQCDLDPLLLYQPNNAQSLMNKVLDLDKIGAQKCLLPCTQVDMGAKLNPVNWLDTFESSNHTDKMFTPGYYITIPSTVLYTEMQDHYTLITFIAEFGGWVGLFLGVSILGATEFIFSKMYKVSGNMTCKLCASKCLALLKFACTIGVAIILVKRFQKICGGEISTNIYFVNSLSSISISICSTTNMYRDTAYLGNSSSFWTNLTKISDSIEQVVFQYGNGELVTAYDSKLEKNFTNVMYTLKKPQFDTFIEICHTLDIKHWNRIKKMEVIAKKELTIYVHITGQLLRSGRQGFSFMNKDTTQQIR